MRTWAVIWIVLSVLLLAFPVWFIAYYIVKYVKKTSSLIQKKVEEIKELDKMRTSILEESTSIDPEDSFLADTQESESVNSSVQDAVLLLEIEDEQWAVSDTISEHPVTVEIAEKQKKLLEKLKYEALVAKEKGKLEEYEKKLIEWLAIDENNLDLHKLLADLYFTLGLHKKSLSLLKKIIELDPQDHKPIWTVGEL